MRSNLKSQLSTWRKVNKMPTMEELFNGLTHVVKDKARGVWSYTYPYRVTVIQSEGIKEYYLEYEQERKALYESYDRAIEHGDTDIAKTCMVIHEKNTIEFNNFLRECLQVDSVLCVTGVDEKGLVTVNMYPIKANGKVVNMSYSDKGLFVVANPYHKKKGEK